MFLKKILFALIFPTVLLAQNKPADKPKLVVGIVVDQMRYDYLYRFYSKYSDKGLKRLMNDGFNCRNNHYQYASTVTGPGHAHIYTGSVPAISGIVGNEWYDKVQNKNTYVVDDSTVSIVGEGNPSAGKMSPRNLKVTTITDQLRISSQFKSKVIGVAIKDRGSILPAGHTGTAYWFESSKGNWISSDYYMKDLPKWVKDFNAKNIPHKLVEKAWQPYAAIEKYTETEDDLQPYENKISGDTSTTFPHNIKVSSIATSPYGNDLTKQFALAAFDAENLGRGEYTDFLAVSFSTPDYVGHSFGPQSKEIEDVYIRFDKDIADMLAHFDKTLGAGNYTVFLSADHGVAEIPAYLTKHNIPSGLFLGGELKRAAQKIMTDKFGEGKYFLDYENYELYLNKTFLNEKNISIQTVTQTLRDSFTKMDGVYDVINIEDAANASITPYYKNKLTNIYNPKRSGEIIILVEPAWFAGYIKGTTHGTMYSYDTHIPLLFYGFGVNKGQTFNNTFTCDVAPTLAQILKILEPNGSIGSPISESIKK